MESGLLTSYMFINTFSMFVFLMLSDVIIYDAHKILNDMKNGIKVWHLIVIILTTIIYMPLILFLGILFFAFDVLSKDTCSHFLKKIFNRINRFLNKKIIKCK
ncbi:hypothetical protein [Alkaliphilus sp. B6464]|uniref:hypothetical protein n=1 Tax=Alkaliphilus sp. B6464 TaxID=2731219 RepID=UPI001BA5C1DE|nr:hypothetical protein [Alkaliphilus sp. B6464]QUH22192.1 hypothetical protein HYG84_20000 [Alkaliphilus sp. B6464]